MNALKSVRLQTRVGSFLSKLSPAQHAVVGFSTWIFIFTFIHDAFTFIFSPLYPIEYLPKFMAGSLFSFTGIAVPFLFILGLPPIVQEYWREVKNRWPILLVMLNLVFWSIVIVILISFFFGVFLIAEILFPTSVVPFTTITCAVLWIAFAIPITDHLTKGRRVIILVTILLLILSMRYVDWNTRKPFARGLFRVQKGMTGVEVESIMGRYLKNWAQPESAHYLHLNPNFTGETWYRHTREAWANADWGKVVFHDGRVVDVEICLCD
ncbi:MAG TPA: hypothetical protein VNO70_03665 [Blastocatellia bacterium]|nr:hypothetical protein [Blastocatellia bacterium]